MSFDILDVKVNVIDDFFDNPDAVRALALRQRYYRPKDHPDHLDKGQLVSTHPGKRTEKLNEIVEMQPTYLEVIDGYKNKFGYNDWWYHSVFFQSTRKQDLPSWVHQDEKDLRVDKRVLICYLSPNPDENAGTSFYDKTGPDANIIFNIKNKYNRAFVYDSRYYHQSNDYFGDTLKNGRLFLISFIQKHN